MSEYKYEILFHPFQFRATSYNLFPSCTALDNRIVVSALTVSFVSPTDSQLGPRRGILSIYLCIIN